MDDTQKRRGKRFEDVKRFLIRQQTVKEGVFILHLIYQPCPVECQCQVCDPLVSRENPLGINLWWWHKNPVVIVDSDSILFIVYKLFAFVQIKYNWDKRAVLHTFSFYVHRLMHFESQIRNSQPLKWIILPEKTFSQLAGEFYLVINDRSTELLGYNFQPCPWLSDRRILNTHIM